MLDLEMIVSEEDAVVQKQRGAHWSIYMLALVAFVVVVSISGIFVIDRMIAARTKMMWVDENFNIKRSIRPVTSYRHLFLKGPEGQGSPTPLDYALVKILDQNRQKFQWFHLHPNIYYRLVALGSTVGSVLYVCLLFLRDILRKRQSLGVTALQLILLCLVPIAYLFSQFMMHYAVEVRPYALWNALWLMALATTLSDSRRRNIYFGGILILLALTSTGAIFQIMILMAIYTLVRFFEIQSVKRVVFEVLTVFMVPIIITLYYILLKSGWGIRFEEQWTRDFYTLWNQYFITLPLLGIVTGICWLKKETRIYSVAPLAVMGLYTVGPVIFMLLKRAQTLYNLRYFIYYCVMGPIFILTLIKVLPSGLVLIKNKWGRILTIIGVLLFVAIFTFDYRAYMGFSKAVTGTWVFMSDPRIQNIYLKDISPNELSYWNSDVFFKFE